MSKAKVKTPDELVSEFIQAVEDDNDKAGKILLAALVSRFISNGERQAVALERIAATLEERNS